MTRPDRIVINPKILNGKAIIRGTRIPVSLIIKMIRDGSSFEDIIMGYPRLTREDIQAALDYSIHLIEVEDLEVIPLSEG